MGLKPFGVGRSTMTTVGVLTAAAMCIGPVSFEMKETQRLHSPASCGIVRQSKMMVLRGIRRASRAPAPLFRTKGKDDASRRHCVRCGGLIRRSDAELPNGGSDNPAPGKMPMSGESVRRCPPCATCQRSCRPLRASADAARGASSTSMMPSGFRASKIAINHISFPVMRWNAMIVTEEVERRASLPFGEQPAPRTGESRGCLSPAESIRNQNSRRRARL